MAINPIINNAALFPSPCGVLVLKVEKMFGEPFAYAAGFRPLAGFWFLKGLQGVRPHLVVVVSVPLRGSGS